MLRFCATISLLLAVVVEPSIADDETSAVPRAFPVRAFPSLQQQRSVPEPLTPIAHWQDDSAEPSSQLGPNAEASRFQGTFLGDPNRFNIGLDLYSEPDFEGGLVIYGENVAMKVGGFVKADFIYDFDPIESEDSFVTTTIPVGAPDRTNARAHARQTRLSLDTRWPTRDRLVKIYVEGDFFGSNEQFRLRHAYGEVENLMVGKTWTTFTYVGAAPATLDFEGSVSSVNRRQALARWTIPLAVDNTTLALAVEDTEFTIDAPQGVMGEPRSPSPDFVSHLRYKGEWFRGQIAGLYRIGGFQPVGESVVTGTGWGVNTAGVIQLEKQSKVYSQIVFGEGIGSYRDLPDAAPASAGSVPLFMFGWMIGLTHDWNSELSSNFTYARNVLNNTNFQPADDVHKTTYLAVNLIWKPLDRVKVGVEYLYGTRVNVDGRSAAANRLQSSFIFDLP